MLVATAHSSTALLLGMGVTGVFSVVTQVAVAYTAVLSNAGERGRNVGAVTAGVMIGIIGARSVSGWVADAAGWRAVYTASAVVSILLAAIAAAALPQETSRRAPNSYLAGVTSVITRAATNRLFRTRAVITMFLFASFGTLWSGLVFPLSATPWQMSSGQIGLFGLAGLAGALGATRAGRWADRGHVKKVTAGALLALTVSWLFIATAPHTLWTLIIGIVVLDFAVQAVHVTSQQQIVEQDPNASSRIIGSYMIFYSVGSGIGAIASSSAYHAAGWTAVCITGAAFALAALATATLAAREDGDRASPRPGHHRNSS